MALYYRIARHNPAEPEDFLSEFLVGRPPREDVPDDPLLFWYGVSIWRTEAIAREKASRWPKLGRFIAEIDVRPDPLIVLRQTTRNRDHFTVWGLPDRLHGCLVQTFRV